MIGQILSLLHRRETRRHGHGLQDGGHRPWPLRPKISCLMNCRATRYASFTMLPKRRS